MQWHKADPTSHWTGTETGQMIAGAQWNIFEENPYLEIKPPMAAYWIQEGNAENSVSLLRAIRCYEITQEGTELRSIADSILNNFLAGRPHRMNRAHMRESSLVVLYVSLILSLLN